MQPPRYRPELLRRRRQIIIADVSMSLDNVLAVAGAAKGSTLVLVIGLPWRSC